MHTQPRFISRIIPIIDKEPIMLTFLCLNKNLKRAKINHNIFLKILLIIEITLGHNLTMLLSMISDTFYSVIKSYNIIHLF